MAPEVIEIDFSPTRTSHDSPKPETTRRVLYFDAEAPKVRKIGQASYYDEPPQNIAQHNLVETTGAILQKFMRENSSRLAIISDFLEGIQIRVMQKSTHFVPGTPDTDFYSATGWRAFLIELLGEVSTRLDNSESSAEPLKLNDLEQQYEQFLSLMPDAIES